MNVTFTGNWTSLDPADLDELTFGSEDNVKTAQELIKLNGTPFADVLWSAERIYEYTLQHQGGTFSSDSGESIETDYGYAVGGYLTSVKIKLGDYGVDDERATKAIAEFIQRIPRDIHGEKHYYLGTWVEDDVLHIDAVKRHCTFDHALDEAARLKQEAIYCFNDGTTIYLKDWVKRERTWVSKSVEEEIEKNRLYEEAEEAAKPTVKVEDVVAFLKRHQGAYERLQVVFITDYNKNGKDVDRRLADEYAGKARVLHFLINDFLAQYPAK